MAAAATTLADKNAIADLVATHGSSSATAWLEFERYKLWRPEQSIPQSTFLPVQGYMEKGDYIFAWGNPLVSDTAALPAVARLFIEFCEEREKHAVWACVDRDLEEVLAGPGFGWATVSCIYEDVVDPAHVVELTAPEAKGTEGQRVVKDLKKNLSRAEKYNVKVDEMQATEWTQEDMLAVEQGIKDWKENKSGVQIASTAAEPWLDSEHRRYWLARVDGKVCVCILRHSMADTRRTQPVGILILTPVQSSSWQIKNAVSFPSAPKGTSEALIYAALNDLHAEQEEAQATGKPIPHPAHGNIDTTPVQPPSGSVRTSGATSETTTGPSETSLNETSERDISPNDGLESGRNTPGTSNVQCGDSPERSKTHHRDENRVTVTFGISASPEFQPIRNLGGWKVKALSKTYKKVASGAKLIQRGEFRVRVQWADASDIQTDSLDCFCRPNLTRRQIRCMSVTRQMDSALTESMLCLRS